MEFTINTLLGISVILGALVIVGLLYGWVLKVMLHSLTLDRLQDGAWEQDETLAKCVRMAHCALADAQHAQDTAVLAGGKVTSESVGNWSRSVQQDDAQSGSFERRCLRIAAQYIPIRSGLLYRGVSGC